jgi:hypothetical protein
MNKRSSIFQRINQILAEEWRGEDEVKREVVEELTEKNIISKKVSQQVIKETMDDGSTLDGNCN